ncbi:MAG TPA: phosphoribosylanthranilate isomerase [Tahibacter sp.]|nr:phosphoribosylanthranilate isomerase [Tahibacter sp.]
MSRVRIKFCGLTRADDVAAACALGVDAVGFVLTRRSKRYVDLDAAVALRRAVAPFVATVALVMDDEPAWVAEVISRLAPDLLQFHGSESAAYCAGFARPYLKALPMGDAGVDVAAYAREHDRAAGFLLDSHAFGEPGGSGRAFDWTRMPADIDRPLIVAGGLDAANVGDAVRIARPFAVDVSSGIESAPGIKDFEKMKRFVQAVKMADTA